jgi:TolB-like protein
VTEPSHAVFLSYASQDTQAAQRICEALRAAGIEVWFDQSELRGGDAWDQKIRREIHDCALFIPIVSQHTQERLEGYFRHEWKLAIERIHHMAEQKTFLVPVVVDGTGDQEAFVPDAFRDVQWTRLPAGETPPEFVTRIQKLLSRESGPLPTVARRPTAVTSSRSSRLVPAVLAVMLAAVTAYLLVEKPWTAKSVAFAPPPHSIAVLPFVNMSGDKEQEYFSDGLTEELLNSLAEINELQVAARTSAFSFKGKDTDIGTIARKLNVGAVLEGSVRRSGNTVRITTQLINAVTGYHLWSHTYDRDLGDVLKLETEIAGAVASALKVNLLGDIATRIELGGTRNPAAFDAYLRATKASYSANDERGYQEAVTKYTKAINLDNNYALAFAGRSRALLEVAENAPTGDLLDRALLDARRAIALAPELASGHLALAGYYESSLDIAHTHEEIERAVALAPGEAEVLLQYGRFATSMGRADAGIAAVRRAVVLDPMNAYTRTLLGRVLFDARRYEEALKVFREALTLDPDRQRAVAWSGYSYYQLGNLQSARSICETKHDCWMCEMCLAFVYGKLGRHNDAEAMLAKLRSRFGDEGAYGYTEIYAQWSDNPQALRWLDRAYQQRDVDLLAMKADPLLDPLRNEPRFQAIEQELRFPN